MTKTATAASAAHADPIKEFVIVHFWQLAADGLAERTPMRDGNVVLRLSTGEAFLSANRSGAAQATLQAVTEHYSKCAPLPM